MTDVLTALAWALKLNQTFFYKGERTVQQLFCLDLGVLSNMYAELQKEQNDQQVGGLLEAANSKKTIELSYKMLIVKWVFEHVQAQQQAVAASVAKASQKATLDEIIAAKQNNKLLEMDLDQLLKMRNEL